MRSVFIVAVVLVQVLSAQTPYDSLYLKSPLYKDRTSQFEKSRTDSADVIFFGNSITFGGQWNELLGRKNIVNMGIVGDNTVGMLHRLQYVYQLRPTLCFIMAGINDLYADAPVEKVFRNYAMIIDTLFAHRIIPVIQSTLHVNPKWKRAAQKNIEVKELNRLLQQYAEANNIEFVDVNSVLSANGTLREEYTSDGVHLVTPAYARWKELVVPVLNKHGL